MTREPVKQESRKFDVGGEGRGRRPGSSRTGQRHSFTPIFYSQKIGTVCLQLTPVVRPKGCPSVILVSGTSARLNSFAL